MQPWCATDASSRLLINVAADRPAVPRESLTTEDLRLARRHGLLGILAHSSDPRLRDPATPPYLLRALRRATMTSYLNRLLVSLATENIRAAVLKGPYVAMRYPNPDVRTFGDIDLLIRRDDLERALSVIDADPAVGGIPPTRPRMDKRDFLVRVPSGVHFNLDVHWDLFSYSQLRGAARDATAVVWDRAVEDREHQLGPLWCLPTDAEVGFLCAHAILDHRFRLILLRDLAEIAAHWGGSEWESHVRFAFRWQLRSVSYLAWLMASGLVGARVPSEALRALRPSSFPVWVLDRLLPRIDVVRFDGHRPHPVNLAAVLLHDDRLQRVMLAARAPLAAPGWWRRTRAYLAGRPRDGGRSRRTSRLQRR